MYSYKGVLFFKRKDLPQTHAMEESNTSQLSLTMMNFTSPFDFQILSQNNEDNVITNFVSLFLNLHIAVYPR